MFLSFRIHGQFEMVLRNPEKGIVAEVTGWFCKAFYISLERQDALGFGAFGIASENYSCSKY